MDILTPTLDGAPGMAPVPAAGVAQTAPVPAARSARAVLSTVRIAREFDLYGNTTNSLVARGAFEVFGTPEDEKLLLLLGIRKKVACLDPGIVRPTFIADEVLDEVQHIGGYEFYPDAPVVGANGCHRTYERAQCGGQQHFDIAPATFAQECSSLGTTVWTSNARNADSIASLDVQAVSTCGVKAKTPELRAILRRSRVLEKCPKRYIFVFDSDFSESAGYYATCCRLMKILGETDCAISTVTLQPTPAGAATTLADFVGRGGTVDELSRLVRPFPASPVFI